jgi:hypothetical protein
MRFIAGGLIFKGFNELFANNNRLFFSVNPKNKATADFGWDFFEISS